MATSISPILEVGIPSRSEILEWCSDPDRKIISREGQHPEVIRKGTFAIKHGRVSSKEADNQREACRLVDPACLGVPYVFDFFEQDTGEGTNGYLVMQYVDGLDYVDFLDPTVIQAITDALTHLHTFQHDVLGPVSGDEWEGLLWDDAPAQHFKSKADLESFVNSRLIGRSERFQILNCDLSFTHLDAAPRNIKITENGVVYLLDWATAGYFPRFFEISALHLNTGENGRDGHYGRILAESLEARQNLNEVQARNVKYLMEYVGNSIKYSFSPQTKSKGRKMKKIDPSAMLRERPYL